MSKVSRRSVLAAGAVGGVMTVAAQAAGVFGNPDLPPQGAVNATNPQTLTDPGPQNPALANNLPSFIDPPPTDVGGMPQFWSSFNIAPKRIQDGGWARQVTHIGLPDLDRHRRREHAALCRRRPRAALAPAGRMGGHDARELPRHDARCPRASLCRGREGGRPLVLPRPALPHSLQGLGPDGAEFVLAFDNGAAARIQHAAADRLAGAYAAGRAGQEFRRAGRRLQEHPACSSAGSSRARSRARSMPTRKRSRRRLARRRSRSSSACRSMKPNKVTKGGQMQIADSSNFRVVHDRRRRPGHGKARRDAGAALASERRRVAVLHQGRGPHDGVQHRAGRHDRRFPARRHRLRKEEPRPLRRNPSARRPTLVGCMPSTSLSGSTASSTASKSTCGGAGVLHEHGVDRGIGVERLHGLDRPLGGDVGRQVHVRAVAPELRRLLHLHPDVPSRRLVVPDQDRGQARACGHPSISFSIRGARSANTASATGPPGIRIALNGGSAVRR